MNTKYIRSTIEEKIASKFLRFLEKNFYLRNVTNLKPLKIHVYLHTNEDNKKFMIKLLSILSYDNIKNTIIVSSLEENPELYFKFILFDTVPPYKDCVFNSLNDRMVSGTRKKIYAIGSNYQFRKLSGLAKEIPENFRINLEFNFMI